MSASSSVISDTIINEEITLCDLFNKCLQQAAAYNSNVPENLQEHIPPIKSLQTKNSKMLTITLQEDTTTTQLQDFVEIAFHVKSLTLVYQSYEDLLVKYLELASHFPNLEYLKICRRTRSRVLDLTCTSAVILSFPKGFTALKTLVLKDDIFIDWKHNCNLPSASNLERLCMPGTIQSQDKTTDILIEHLPPTLTELELVNPGEEFIPSTRFVKLPPILPNTLCRLDVGSPQNLELLKVLPANLKHAILPAAILHSTDKNLSSIWSNLKSTQNFPKITTMEIIDDENVMGKYFIPESVEHIKVSEMVPPSIVQESGKSLVLAYGLKSLELHYKQSVERPIYQIWNKLLELQHIRLTGKFSMTNVLKDDTLPPKLKTLIICQSEKNLSRWNYGMHPQKIILEKPFPDTLEILVLDTHEQVQLPSILPLNLKILSLGCKIMLLQEVTLQGPLEVLDLDLTEYSSLNNLPCLTTTNPNIKIWNNLVSLDLHSKIPLDRLEYLLMKLLGKIDEGDELVKDMLQHLTLPKQIPLPSANVLMWQTSDESMFYSYSKDMFHTSYKTKTSATKMSSLHPSTQSYLNSNGLQTYALLPFFDPSSWLSNEKTE
jgi:hypothetical protein